jgi:hypothetical protein
MSADTVDDLHQAEDLAGTLAGILDRLITAGALNDHPDLASAAITGRAAWADYCRPTCGAEGDPAAAEETCEDPECCGCPCGHGDLDDGEEEPGA